jgi:IMP dehydrogenase
MLEYPVRECLTFDDVLLLPAESQVLPRQANVETRLTPTISLRIPLLAAAMDTVTEAQTAIAMAAEGGLGVIHKNLSIQAQALEVTKVKKYESGMVVNPVTIDAKGSLSEAVGLMHRMRLSGVFAVCCRL